MVIYPMDSTIHAAFEHLGPGKDNTLGNSKKNSFCCDFILYLVIISYHFVLN